MDLLVKRPARVPDDIIAVGKANKPANFGNILLERGPEDECGFTGLEFFASLRVEHPRGDTVNIVLVSVKAVIARFVLCVEEDEHTAGEADT